MTTPTITPPVEGRHEPVVRWPAHELDLCNHIFQQRSSAVVWASDGTGGLPPVNAPTVIDEECILCGAWRQRWL